MTCQVSVRSELMRQLSRDGEQTFRRQLIRHTLANAGGLDSFWTRDLSKTPTRLLINRPVGALCHKRSPRAHAGLRHSHLREVRAQVQALREILQEQDDE